MLPEREDAPSPGRAPTTYIDCRDYRPGDDPLEGIVGATPADRLGWALAELGIDPVPFDLTDDDSRPGTVVVRTPLRTAARGLLSVWWDLSEGRAVGVCSGSDEDYRAGAAALEAFTAQGPGDLPLGPPEDPLDPSSVVISTAHRLGLKVRSRSWASGNDRNMSAIFAVRDWLESENAAELGLKTSDRFALLALVVHMNREGQRGRPGAERIAALTGYKEQTAARSLRRLQAAGLIDPTVLHPSKGNAQVWRFSDAFVAVLGGAKRARIAGLPSPPMARDSGPPQPPYGGDSGPPEGPKRASPAPPKHKKAKSAAATAESDEDEYVLDLARAETARRVAAGEKIDSPEPFAKHLAREDPDRLLAEDAERRAVAEDTAALAGCSDCDRDGLRWWKTDGTPATRETPRALSERCDHAGNVVPIQAGAR